jgi:hypothetical protein
VTATTKLMTWSSAMLTCVCEALTEMGQGPTCWCGLWPGAEVAWDYCGECSDDGKCGMAYIRQDIAFPYSSFPFADSDTSCKRPIAYRFEIGVIRCMPVMNEEGELPSVDEVMATTLGMMADQHALLCAIRECKGTGLVAIEGWTPFGPESGCVGGAWAIYVDPHG